MIMEPVVNLEIDPEPIPITLEPKTKSLVDMPGFLPEIPIKKKRVTKSIVPPPPQKITLDMDDDSDTSTTNID